MNALLDKAIAAMTRLPDAEQEAIARELLDRIDADARWDRLFADPRSARTLSRLLNEARDDIALGNVEASDPSNKPSP